MVKHCPNVQVIRLDGKFKREREANETHGHKLLTVGDLAAALANIDPRLNITGSRGTAVWTIEVDGETAEVKMIEIAKGDIGVKKK